MGSARLSDIAARAGVSEATVSRVLNGKSSVADATRRAVLDAVDGLGYARPSRLRRRAHGLIGLIIPELDNPIFPVFAQAIERALVPHRCTPLLCTQTPGGASEDACVEMLVEQGVSGIVVVSGRHADVTADASGYARLVGRGVPLVLLDGCAPAVGAPCLSTDDRLAARQAVTHLVELGHERIGFAAGPERFVPVIRKGEGFRRATAELLGSAGPVRHSLFTVEGGRQAAGALLDLGCTGIVCASDLMALGAIAAVRDRGLVVPGDVSVVGFDDSPLVAFVDPPLTTVRKPVRAMARAVADTLVGLIGGEPMRHGELLFQPELIVRSSTAAAPDGRGGTSFGA
ncbi:LacI family DNA-binding transcriptional regulator [Rhizohabitans arisaemae]|uniref:LacI family DNA-binding transcriptional regulator n=1 Tax=Rhizohabitans arisaemae TaxID=2720610 RepID=UPI0024B1798E|nr:LacI family DNA-binding transcriptional regulator [Rhizohabitans arisaemae]